MRKAILYNIVSFSKWCQRMSLFLVLSFATTLIISDGWLMPKSAEAAITQIVTPASAVGTTAPASANVTIPLSVAGNKRTLIVGVTVEGATASTGTNAQVNCTYGGTALTAVPGTDNSATSALEHTYMFYMLDNTTLMNNTARALTFTINGFVMTGNSIHYAVYDGTAQAAPQLGTTSNSGITDATTISLPSNLIIVSGDYGFVVAMTSRSGSTTARTFTTPTNWTSIATAAANATSPATNRYFYSSTTAASTSVALTASGLSRLSMSGAVLKMADVTAPSAVTGLTVSPTVSTYTSTSPIITASITEPDAGSSVSCEYTTNGSTWAAGVVTGSTPTFTCTATPTGLSGSLTINMRATSTGGGPTTGTQITRTVDAAGPSTVTLTPSPGYTNNALYWTAATDALSGTKNYTVRFQATTPPTCSTGTSLYTGANLNYVHTGLTANTTYGYVVCANDNVGNQTQAATAAITTTTRASVVNNCGGCHVYLGTQNPVADGTARNTPDGKFLGSHATHAGDSAGQYAYVCAKCHIAPNNNLSHMNRNLEMSNPINGDTGAKYGKGTSWPVTNSPSQFQNCTATYCHSNGTSVATGTLYTNISSPRWNTAITTCNKCHGKASWTNGAPMYPNYNNYSAALPTNTGWTNPGYALHDDNATATYTAATQQPLVFTSFAIAKSALPAGKTITGISVSVKGKSATSRTLNVAMTKTGNATIAGTAKTVALTPTNAWHVVNTAVNDLWGTTWATTDILGTANTTFGIIVKDNAATTSDIAIDAVKVTVHTADGPKFNSHSAHTAKSYGCNKCHYATTTNGTSITDVTVHAEGAYNVVAGSGASFTFTNTQLSEPTCSNVSCHANAVWGVTKLGCIDCHSVSIARTLGSPGTTLAAVTTEFGLAWGHKKSGRNAVGDADCIVCHLEGAYATQKPSGTYHANGNIDLRDPDGTGETPITNMSNAAWTFSRFSTSYATGSRTSTGHTSNNVDNVITQKFCLKCHDLGGATNTTARSNNGGTGTANMPFGGINLGATYTVLNGASVAGGVVNVYDQFAPTNSSVHPVRGPNNHGLPTAARMNNPYKPSGTRVDAGTTKTDSIVLNCFDCHNQITGGLLTLRTIAAHGSGGTQQVRGTFYVSTPSLCISCHAGYNVAPGATGNHGAGSALNTNLDGGENMTTTCHNCHASSTAVPARPIKAFDYHGFNKLLSGNNWPTGGLSPYAFIRNVTNFAGTGYHRPARSAEFTTGSATCNGGTGCAGNGSARTYTPGGQY